MNEQPTTPRIAPSALIGHSVQIALSEFELGGPHILIPPLRVEKFAIGPPGRGGFSIIYFLGKPLEGFHTIAKEGIPIPQYVAIRFFSDLPQLQPQYLLDDEFRRNEKYVPVEVWATDNVEKIEEDTLKADEDFFYVGVGVLQVFISGIGFPESWPDHYGWRDGLKENERKLIQIFSGMSERRASQREDLR